MEGRNFTHRRQALTSEQFLKLLFEFADKPDATVDQFMDEAAKRYPNNTAVHRIQFLSDQNNARLLDKINESSVTDHIVLNGRDDQALIKLWAHEIGIKVDISSDLILKGTIPIMDCRITIDEKDINPHGLVCEYRVIIFQDYSKLLEASKPREKIIIGAVMCFVNSFAWVAPVMAAREEKELYAYEKTGFYKASPEDLERLSFRLPKESLLQNTGAILQTWYGIQTAMLNEKVRSIFEHPQKEVIVGSDINDRHSIRKHVIHADDIEKALKE